MRTHVLVSLAAITILRSASIAAEKIEYRFDLPEGETLSDDNADSSGSGLPFVDEWVIAGVEQGTYYSTIITRCDVTPPARTERTPLPKIDLSSELWTKKAISYSRCVHWPYYESDWYPVVSPLPPFDETWLLGAIWPLTRSIFDRAADLEPRLFSRDFVR
jgi:hypothetical protein